MIESFSAFPAEKEFPSSVVAISFPFSPLEKVTSNCVFCSLIFLNVTLTSTLEVILTLVTLSPWLPPSVVTPPVIVHLSTS